MTTDRGFYFGAEGGKATPEYVKSIGSAHEPESLAKVLAQIAELDGLLADLGRRLLSLEAAK
jgi:hypothetical protein